MLIRPFFLFLVLLFTSNSVFAATSFIINGVHQADDSGLPGEDRKVINDAAEDGWRWYEDRALGFRLMIPSDSVIDASLAPVVTRFTTADATIQVFFDDFTNKPVTFRDYVYYSNRFLTQENPWQSLTDDRDYGAGHLSRWERKPLSWITNDKPYYLALAYPRNEQEAYTVMVNSTTPPDTFIADSFAFIEKEGIPHFYKQPIPSKTVMNSETQTAFNRLFGPNAKLTWGIFDMSAPQTFQRLEEKEAALNYQFSVLVRYQTMDEPMPRTHLERAAEHGRLVELTLQTTHRAQADALRSGGVPDNATMLYQILDGRYDDYFATYVAALKEFNKPVLFRLDNEMNGDWCWYSAFYTARDAALYRAVWRYLHRYFTDQGVTNLVWVWNPHDVALPAFSWNHHLLYYPGDDVVDVVGLTGYNTGTYFPGEKWRTFREIYDPLYAEYSALYNKPFMITEFAANSVGGDKPDWIRHMFQDMRRYPNIKVAVWWNGVDYDVNDQPGRVYLIDQTPEVIAAMREGLSVHP